VPSATARAHANIALVKYWGKRDAALNLPAAGSLSLTLAALTTTTTVEFDRSLDADSFELNGQMRSGVERSRISIWLDLVRERAALRAPARVVSRNDFPTASGLASSASAYAALALAATNAAGLALEPSELSVLARRGSGSAARSLFGGFVRMNAGSAANGDDAYAQALDSASDWPLCMVIAVVGGGVPKAISSRSAMEHCAETSPLYSAWLASVPSDLAQAERAIARRDLAALGEVAEGSAMAMHAAAMAARPATLYFAPATMACLAAVRELRATGVPAYFTIDAGPHVKVLTLEQQAQAVRARLAEIPGVSQVLESGVGGPAELTCS
jgi:diphosphomevalonate decarboxylase